MSWHYDRVLDTPIKDDETDATADGSKCRKRRLSVLDRYVVFSITALLVYSVIERYLTYRTGMPADTLTTCFYAAFGGEILSCCLIKIFKLREDTR